MARSVLLGTFVSIFALIFLVSLSLKIYLATPMATAQVSRMLTSILHYEVNVAGLHMTGGTLSVKGFSIDNPPGFTGGPLAVADSVTVAPRWRDLVRGRRGFSLIELENARIDLRRNNSGVWNMAELLRLLAAKKSSTETFIARLVIKNGAIRVNGHGVEGISLRLNDLTTKGSADTRMFLTFKDEGGNSVQVDGTARAGNDPFLDLSVNAPAISLDLYEKQMKKMGRLALEKGTASLKSNAGLHSGLFSATGRIGFGGITAQAGGRTIPLAGELNFSTRYDIRRDEGRVDNLLFAVNDLLKVRVSGTASSIRGERRFTTDVRLDDIDLTRIAPLLPARDNRKIIIGGRVASSGIHLAGDGAHGLAVVKGTLVLRGGELAVDDRLLVSGLFSTVNLSGNAGGVLAKGKMFLSGSRGKAYLEELDAPFSVSLSNRLKPLAAEIPSLFARIQGIPVKGRLGFRPAVAEPFTASFQVPATSLTIANSLMNRSDMKVSAGTASLSVEAVGRGTRDFSGTASVRSAALKMNKGGKPFGLKEGSLLSRFAMKGGRFAASGDVRLDGVAVNGREGEGRCSYRFVDGGIFLDNVTARLDKVKASFNSIAGRVAAPWTVGNRHVLFLRIAGGEIIQGDVAVSGLSADFRGAMVADAAGKWMEGEGSMASGVLSWRGKPVGSPSIRLAISRTKGQGEIGGSLLDGRLTGTVSVDLSAIAEGGPFNLGFKGAKLANTAGMFAGKMPVTLADGLLDGGCSGAYSPGKGLVCRFEARGSGIAVKGAGGKSLVTGVGGTLTGGIAGQKISLDDAVLTASDGVALRIKGAVDNTLSQQRQGRIAFTLAKVSLGNLMDPFVNLLPRLLQEATTGGSVAAEGTVALKGREGKLDGFLLLDGVQLDVPSQKLVVAGVSGKVPFSLDFPGAKPERPHETLTFSQENYPLLLEKLRQGPRGGSLVKVGKVRFGPLEMGETNLYLKAANGVTEIVSLQSGLYEGSVLGKGFFALRGGMNYGGDFLVNDLSLRQLCNAFPKIKGYITGRVDGIVSLYGEGKGLNGLSGFIDLWTREGHGEKMLVSKEFLQRLAGKKLRGFFFRDDRPYDEAEISADLEEGYLTFETLDISHTNLLGIHDLSVSVAPVQNRIAIDHLFNAIKQAAARGKAVGGEEPPPAEAPADTEFKWQE